VINNQTQTVTVSRVSTGCQYGGVIAQDDGKLVAAGNVVGTWTGSSTSVVVTITGQAPYTCTKVNATPTPTTSATGATPAPTATR
jgi:hypothetical protein